MKWSFKLFKMAGIDVYVHATFFILLIWIGISYWTLAGTISAAISGVVFVLALFACVVLHEFGHALTARRYGITTEKITLLPIGGVASLHHMPSDPRQEITVALAGPAVNIVIAGLLWLWLTLTNSLVPFAELDFIKGSFLQRLMVINLVLAIFNLLPAFPMDGGRVLRAALAFRMDHVRATQVAAAVGQGLALWLGLFGLLYNPFLIFIALFVWIGAAAEAESEKIKSTISDSTVGKAMLTDFHVLSPNDHLSHAIELTLAGSQNDFPVIDERGNEKIPVGVLTQEDMLKGLQAGGKQSLVKDYMQSEIQSVDINESLESILDRFRKHRCPLISITQNQHMVGVINLENIVELISIESALNEQDNKNRFGA